MAMVEVVDKGSEDDIKALADRIEDLKNTFTDHIDACKLLSNKIKSYLSSK